MLIYWGIKTRSNESLRQEFFTTYVPKLWDLGISVPDPKLAFDPGKGEWDWSEPDWDEFWQVVKGNGPMTSVRLLRRKTVWDTHAWVREAFAGIPAAA
jgi:ring-1,2-phenylacetyl-CoA epoxidase subunit PaaA